MKKLLKLSLFTSIFLFISFLNYEKAYSQDAYDQIYSGTEKINSFDSQIYIYNDGSMTVEETINVTSTGNSIQRGIYRDFPTIYRGMFGLTEKTSFEILEIKKDGYPEI